MSRLQLVLKLSKLCNLRCRYCYEFEHLSDAERMPLEIVRQSFARVAELGDRISGVDIILHGGEPLILPVDYLDGVLDAAEGLRLRPGNVAFRVQSNGYRVSDRHLDWLQRRSVSIGLSLDYIGDERLTAGGRPTQEAALRTLARLRDRGLGTGAICVVGAHNHQAIPEALAFFRGLGLSVRLSPIHKDGSPGQNVDRRLPASDVLGAFKRAFDIVWSNPDGPRVQPIHAVIRHCATYLGFRRARRRRRYDPFLNPGVIVVQIDGSFHGHRDDPSASAPYGNVRTTSFLDRHLTAAGAAGHLEIVKLQGDACARCQFFGACDGRYMAEATAEELRAYGDGGCAVFGPLHAHVSDAMRDDPQTARKLNMMRLG